MSVRLQCGSRVFHAPSRRSGTVVRLLPGRGVAMIRVAWDELADGVGEVPAADLVPLRGRVEVGDGSGDAA